MSPSTFHIHMFWIKEMGIHAGSMRTGASSRGETIQVNGEVLEYQISGTKYKGTSFVIVPYISDNSLCKGQCRMPYEISRMGVRNLPTANI